MKKLFLMIGVAIFINSPISWAQGSGDEMSVCEFASAVAEFMMDGRQNGVTLPKAMEIIGEIGGSGELRELLEEMLLDAYDSPGYSTEEMKTKATNEFINKWTMMCLRDIRGGK